MGKEDRMEKKMRGKHKKKVTGRETDSEENEEKIAWKIRT